MPNLQTRQTALELAIRIMEASVTKPAAAEQTAIQVSTESVLKDATLIASFLNGEVKFFTEHERALDLEICRFDVLYFLRKYVSVETETGNVGFKETDGVRVFLQSVFHPSAAIFANRMTGLTTAAIGHMIHQCIFLDRQTCLMVSANHVGNRSKLDATQQMLESISADFGYKIKSSSSNRIEFESGSEMLFYTASSLLNSPVVGRKVDLLIIDDAKLLPWQILADFNLVVQPCLADNGRRMLLATGETRSNDRIFDALMGRDRQGWVVTDVRTGGASDEALAEPKPSHSTPEQQPLRAPTITIKKGINMLLGLEPKPREVVEIQHEPEPAPAPKAKAKPVPSSEMDTMMDSDPAFKKAFEQMAQIFTSRKPLEPIIADDPQDDSKVVEPVEPEPVGLGADPDAGILPIFSNEPLTPQEMALAKRLRMEIPDDPSDARSYMKYLSGLSRAPSVPEPKPEPAPQPTAKPEPEIMSILREVALPMIEHELPEIPLLPEVPSFPHNDH